MPVVLVTAGDAIEQRQGGNPLSFRDWILIPEAIGVVARVAVWCCAFCLLLIGLFTYPAPVAGAFVLIVLLVRYVRRVRP